MPRSNLGGEDEIYALIFLASLRARMLGQKITWARVWGGLGATLG